MDLAGSESARRTQATGDRFCEGVNINKGLLNLGNVIRALAEKKIHVPYRNSVLTKVLMECLQSTSFISMIACISPTGSDMEETVNTLRFANKAKELFTKPVPSFLLESAGMSAVKKRKFAEMIPPTPGTWNHTIHTPTPSKVAKKNNTKRQLNVTIGTPGRRAVGESAFVTPHSGFSASSMTSTVVRRPLPEACSPESPTFSNLSGVSMIQPPEDTRPETGMQDRDYTADSTNLGSRTYTTQDISAVLSPFLRKITELQITQIQTITDTVAAQLQKINPEIRKTRVVEGTPQRKNRTRMTSSPVMSAAETINTVKNLSADGGSFHNPTNKVQSRDQTRDVSLSPSETIISGTGATLPLSELTNRRLQSVVLSASPELGRRKGSSAFSPSLPVYDSPPSTAPERSKPPSPTIEEMERALGINPDSPGLLFTAPANPGKKTSRSSRARSSRRTTMMGGELEATLQFIREKSSSRRVSGRPVRAAAKGIFYGSPNKENTKKSKPEV